MDPNNPFAELVAEAAAKEAAANKALESAYNTPTIDTNSALGAALGGILPALIGGLAGGKYGFQAGAKGGALGSEFGFKQAIAEGERKRKLGITKAEGLMSEAKDAKKYAQQYRMEDARQTNRDALLDKRLAQQAELQGERLDRMDNRFIQMQGETNSRTQTRNEITRDTQARLEAEALDKDVYGNESIKKGKSVLNAASRVRAILSQPLNQVTLGALRTQIPRFNEEVGNLAQAEQRNAVPATLMEKAQAAINFLRFEADSKVVPADLQKALVDYIDVVEGATRKRLSKELKAIRKGADITAPYLAKTNPDHIDRKFESYEAQLLGSNEENTGESEAQGGFAAPQNDAEKAFFEQAKARLRAQQGR